ncbi:hypothetical protein HAX54_031063 [Datura stramonium]|uniref:NADH-quinone oxidoreductase subunit D domain-containing protein n=1 Tax=Datura stramonium TaxID=4076 RepID=A0ABS8V8J8_DATST|nr:hypothetical protein [Datura stramonium]
MKNQIQEAKEPTSQIERERGSDIEKKGNLGPVFSKQQNDHEKDYPESDTKKGKKKEQYISNTKAELDLFLKRYLLFQLRWNDALTQRMMENIKTPFFYIFRKIELIYDLFEAATERVEGVGIIGGDEALNWGLSGSMLRASGIEWDLCKVDHYESYDEFD